MLLHPLSVLVCIRTHQSRNLQRVQFSLRQVHLGLEQECSFRRYLSFQNVVLEKTPESLLDSKEIKPVNPKGNQLWIFVGRTDAEAEAPVLWPHDAKSWLIGKDPDAGKDWAQEEKEVTEDEKVDGMTDSMDMSLSKLGERVKDREP